MMTPAHKASQVVAAIVALLLALGCGAQVAPTSADPWDHPAAELADQIAAILGPGQAHLTLRNASSIPATEVPAIRKLLEQDLKSHGISASGAESASSIRITLSENVRERLWVAEIVEGSETHVAMVHVEPAMQAAPTPFTGISLRKELVLNNSSVHNHEPVLSVVATGHSLIALGPRQISFYVMSPTGWQPQQTVEITRASRLSRDPRGMLLSNADGNGISAILPGVACTGSLVVSVSAANGGWTAHCNDSDDPWPIAQAPTTGSTTAALKAFYNPARDYFTGV